MYSKCNKIISINPTPAMVTLAYWYKVCGKSHLITIHRQQNAANKNTLKNTINLRVSVDCLLFKYQYPDTTHIQIHLCKEICYIMP